MGGGGKEERGAAAAEKNGELNRLASAAAVNGDAGKGKDRGLDCRGGSIVSGLRAERSGLRRAAAVSSKPEAGPG